MIHYALRCGTGHDFDGWFKDSGSFDQQASSGLLDCPICADTHVTRALMAPNVRTRAPARLPADAAAPAASGPAALATQAGPSSGSSAGSPVGPAGTAVTSAMPDQLRAVLQRIRAEVEKNCDYVGRDFTDTARNIASGVEPPRPIYGHATQEQEAALAEEGIEVARIPWVPRANS